MGEAGRSLGYTYRAHIRKVRLKCNLGVFMGQVRKEGKLVQVSKVRYWA